MSAFILRGRKLQLRQIAEAVDVLERRMCLCGCGAAFRVMPSSPHVYGSLSCASKAGWKLPNMFAADGHFPVDRRWYYGIALDHGTHLAS